MGEMLQKILSGAGNALGGAVEAVGTGAAKIAQTITQREQKRAAYTATPDEMKALKLFDEPRKVRQLTLEVYEPLWTKCILYTAGIQHITQLAGGRVWQTKKVQDWYPLPVINEIQEKVQRAVDFFTRKRPTAYVEPQRQTEENISAAEIGDAVLKHLWIKGDEDDKQDELATWLITTGNAFKKHFIDTTTRNAMRVPKFEFSQEPMIDMSTGQPMIGEDGQPVTSPRYVQARSPEGEPLYDEIPQGDVTSEIVSPLSMTVPLASRSLANAPWVMESQIYPVDQLRELYPDKADFIPEDGAVLTADLYVHRITNLLSTGLHGGIRTVDPYYMRGFALVNFLERAPSKDYPKGVLIVEMDSIPLYIGDLPLERAFSYEHAGYYRVPGRFWYRGMVEDLLAPQDGLNKMEQYLQVNDGFNVNPQWVVPDNAGVADGAIKNKPGNVVKYTYPFKPERVAGEGLPPQIVERRAGYSDDMQKVSGMRDVVLGQNPPGVTAGVALNLLGEQAEGMFDPIAKRYDRFIERCESKKLQFVQRFYTAPRYLAIEVEGGNTLEYPSFVGADLKGNTQVRIEAGSYQPRSKAGMQQLLFDLYDKGLLPQVVADPAQYELFMERIGLDGFYTEQGLDYRRAKWENEMLARTEGYDRVIINPGDDDMIHLATHASFRKTKEYLRLPSTIQMRFLKHEAEHLQHFVETGGMSDPTKIDEQGNAAGDGSGGEAAGEAPVGEAGTNGAGGGSEDATLQ